MAVENYFTNYGTSPGVGEKLEPGRGAYDEVNIQGWAQVAAADSDGSTYLIAKDVPSSFRLTEIKIDHDAITSGTDYDLGVYNSETGAEVDKDLFLDGGDLSSAAKGLDGLSAVDIANIGALKTIAELLGLTASTAKSRYDIVLTANTVGSAAGDAVVRIKGLAS